VGIRDKFFYDALLEKIEERLPKMVKADELVKLGMALGANPDF